MDNQINWRQVVTFAMTFCGRPYSYRDFNCWHFIKAVYEKFGIPMIPGMAIEPIDDFDDPKNIGRLVFLKRRDDKRSLSHTHLAIYIGDHKVVHNTYYLGKKVVVSTMEEILMLYDLVAHPVFLSRTGTSRSAR